VNSSKSLQIPRKLAPAIFVDDIGERYTANRPEPTYGVPDRQQSIRMDAGWQAGCGLRFFLELQVPVAPRPRARGASNMFCTAG
jgi:hypothetical protein